MRKKSLEGVDLLDREDRIVEDVEEAEKHEPLNLRTADSLDLALGEILHANPGGYITNKQYSFPVPGSTYPDELVYDRFYWNHKLLVDFINTPTTEDQKAQVARETTRKKAFANEQGCNYLTIIGQATLADIARIVKP